MKELPHHYPATACGTATGDVVLSSPGLPELATEPPPEFGGSGTKWSPETLLCAAVADCFILTFRGVARGAKLAYDDLTCEVSGELDRVEGQLKFTKMVVQARLVVPPDADVARARALLEKAERGCLISRSLSATTSLVTGVVVGTNERSTSAASA